MVTVLGVLFWFILNIWGSFVVFFSTVPTVGETLFTGGFWSKFLGVILWILILTSWYHLLKGFSWSAH